MLNRNGILEVLEEPRHLADAHLEDSISSRSHERDLDALLTIAPLSAVDTSSKLRGHTVDDVAMTSASPDAAVVLVAVIGCSRCLAPVASAPLLLVVPPPPCLRAICRPPRWLFLRRSSLHLTRCLSLSLSEDEEIGIFLCGLHFSSIDCTMVSTRHSRAPNSTPISHPPLRTYSHRLRGASPPPPVFRLSPSSSSNTGLNPATTEGDPRDILTSSAPVSTRPHTRVQSYPRSTPVPTTEPPSNPESVVSPPTYIRASAASSS
ncbi:hypothetical protein Syun_021764 [Stephania yunnanensis]|uniref:Uncharacterized protein n=1 Tax=Stephania yunnanensis TaxID=152371 RepID=A0AAP0NPE9_9MAGN